MRTVLWAALFSLVLHAALIGLLWLWPAARSSVSPSERELAFTLVWDDDPAQPVQPVQGSVEVQEPPSVPLVPGPMAPAAPVAPLAPVGPIVPLPNPPGIGQTTASRPLSGAVPGTPRSVVFLLDRSLSMGLTGTMRPAREELRALLTTLPATSQFQVIPYSRLAEPLSLRGSQGLVAAEPETLAVALDRLDRLAPEGGTDHFRALKRGLQLRPDCLCLLTDAFDLHDGAVDELVRLNGGRSALHLIELVRSKQSGPSTAGLLAERTRGTHRRILLP